MLTALSYFSHHSHPPLCYINELTWIVIPYDVHALPSELSFLLLMIRGYDSRRVQVLVVMIESGLMSPVFSYVWDNIKPLPFFSLLPPVFRVYVWVLFMMRTKQVQPVSRQSATTACCLPLLFCFSVDFKFNKNLTVSYKRKSYGVEFDRLQTCLGISWQHSSAEIEEGMSTSLEKIRNKPFSPLSSITPLSFIPNDDEINVFHAIVRLILCSHVGRGQLLKPS